MKLPKVFQVYSENRKEVIAHGKMIGFDYFDGSGNWFIFEQDKSFGPFEKKWNNIEEVDSDDFLNIHEMQIK